MKSHEIRYFLKRPLVEVNQAIISAANLKEARGTMKKYNEYQPSDARGTRSLPAVTQNLKNQKWPPRSGKVSNLRFFGAPIHFC